MSFQNSLGVYKNIRNSLLLFRNTPTMTLRQVDTALGGRQRVQHYHGSKNRDNTLIAQNIIIFIYILVHTVQYIYVYLY